MPASQHSDDSQDNDLEVFDGYERQIDLNVFSQILEMDDDDTREFSTSIVTGFMEQAAATLRKLHNELEKKDLPALSALGHFLKGSSATLGLTIVSGICEKIQDYGAHKDPAGEPLTDDDECLEEIRAQLAPLHTECDVVNAVFTKFYKLDEDNGDGEGEDAEEEEDEDAEEEETDEEDK